MKRSRDWVHAQIKHAGAMLHVFALNNQHVAASHDIAGMAWLLDIGVIDSIERGDMLARYKGKVIYE